MVRKDWIEIKKEKEMDMNRDICSDYMHHIVQADLSLRRRGLSDGLILFLVEEESGG